ncbi:nuclear transport factor 2 family protein|uniref:nuclear transport factor 2 family protein n=1 Tax=Pseudomonas sp. SbOxS1 TaxID=2723884 RepID=UPI0015D10B8D|nr:nuclear transport factor 2 family protein [Pseudomonas sp. SbOxS1]NYU06169.1 nuclear transport factor 2 family protein [Pseudomonas sp. SbOxS1]
MSEQQAITAIIERENLRCRVLVAGDIAQLSELVDDQVVHIHATGQTDDKPAYLKLVSEAIRFLRVERKGLEVRVYGDLAIATGRLVQDIELRASGERREMDVVTTQVWSCRQGVWRQVSFQATNL